MSPSPTLLPCPCGSAPFETHRAATSPAPDAATLAAHRRVSTRYPLGIVVSGAVLPPGHKSRSRLPALRPVALPNVLRLLWRIVLRGRGSKALQNQDCWSVSVPPGGRGLDRRTGSLNAAPLS
jgi:hypothetical protein